MAGAGMAGDLLKCLAVSPEVRSEGLLVPLVSRILSERPGQSAPSAWTWSRWKKPFDASVISAKVNSATGVPLAAQELVRTIPLSHISFVVKPRTEPAA